MMSGLLQKLLGIGSNNAVYVSVVRPTRGGGSSGLTDGPNEEAMHHGTSSTNTHGRYSRVVVFAVLLTVFALLGSAATSGADLEPDDVSPGESPNQHKDLQRVGSRRAQPSPEGSRSGFSDDELQQQQTEDGDDIGSRPPAAEVEVAEGEDDKNRDHHHSTSTGRGAEAAGTKGATNSRLLRCIQQSQVIQRIADDWYMQEAAANSATLSDWRNLSKTVDENFLFEASVDTQNLGVSPMGQAIYSRYIFEMYGDSTLREVWETMAKAMSWSTESTQFKRKANTTERGPFYSVHKIVPVANRAKRKHHHPGASSKKRGVKVPIPPPPDHDPFAYDGHAPTTHTSSMCFPYQRVSFRFDYRDVDLVDPATFTSNSTIPAWFLPPDAPPPPAPQGRQQKSRDGWLLRDDTGKVRHDWMTNVASVKDAMAGSPSGRLNAGQALERTAARGDANKDGAASLGGRKIVLFSLGAHLAVRYRNVTSESKLRAILLPKLTAYLQFLSNRKDVSAFIMSTAAYNCPQIMDWKFGRRVRVILRTINCRQLNHHVNSITQMVEEIVGQTNPPLVSDYFASRFMVFRSINYHTVPKVSQRYCTARFCRKYHPSSDGVHLVEQWKWLKTNELLRLAWHMTSCVDGGGGEDAATTTTQSELGKGSGDTGGGGGAKVCLTPSRK